MVTSGARCNYQAAKEEVKGKKHRERHVCEGRKSGTDGWVKQAQDFHPEDHCSWVSVEAKVNGELLYLINVIK